MKLIIVCLLLPIIGCSNHKPVIEYTPTITGYIEECGASWLCPDSDECKKLKESNLKDYELFCEPRW